MGVGRLSREKGFDLLLDAVGQIRKSFPAIDLVIVGEGPEESALRNRCWELGLNSAVRFVGSVAQPAVYFGGATAFVLPSQHEGMPNAMLEAAAGGLPILALPASEGITELSKGQPGVWIGADISADSLGESLTEALKTLRPGARFEHSFLAEFALERAIHGYEELIDRCLFD